MILTDTSYLMALRYLSINGNAMQKAAFRLSTGLRVNSAADDAASLAISTKMRSMIRGLHVAERNVMDAISLLQVTDGALNSAHDILQRMNELAVASASGTFTDADREKMDMEFQQLLEGLGSIVSTTEFNKKPVFKPNSDSSSNNSSGSASNARSISNAIYIQSSANAGDGMYIYINQPDLKALDEVNIKTAENAAKAITAVQNTIDSVSASRALVGAQQNRLEHKIKYIQTYRENLEAADSRLRDADIAEEMMNYVKAQIKQQALMFVLSQAKMRAYNVLALLRLGLS